MSRAEPTPILHPAVSASRTHTNNVRTFFSGLSYLVEIRRDGTAVVRESAHGTPTEITSAAAIHIERQIRLLIDKLAGEAIKQPAPWNPDGSSA